MAIAVAPSVVERSSSQPVGCQASARISPGRCRNSAFHVQHEAPALDKIMLLFDAYPTSN